MSLVLYSGGWYLCGDPVPQQERPYVVYHIPCTNCPQAYIGQTGRTLTQHLKEHRRAVTNGDLATSALAEHAHSTGHPISWTEARVIATCSHTSRWCFLKSWMIHRETNHLNGELGSLPTSIRHSLGIHRSCAHPQTVN